MTQRQILITGATGFIGCRLAETAVARGISAVCLVRSWHKAARLARLPVRMVHGNMLDKHSLREAVRGCDVVFHCAVDSRPDNHRQINVQGTANIMEAALEQKVKRVVYLSSIAVYGFWPSQLSVTEDTPCQYTGDPYCDAKIDAEKVALRYHREAGLPVVILRPSLVYGPFQSLWAERLITSIRKDRMVLVNGGNGICNSLYVDNLIKAMWLATDRENATGNVFIISDAQPVTWKRMIESHAVVLNGSQLPLLEMTVEEIEAARRRALPSSDSSFQMIVRLIGDPRVHQALYTVPAFARLARVARTIFGALPNGTRRLIPIAPQASQVGCSEGEGIQTPVRSTLPKDEVRFYSCNVVFSIERARRILGYEPEIPFSDGMRRTAAWIRWMKL